MTNKKGFSRRAFVERSLAFGILVGLAGCTEENDQDELERTETETGVESTEMGTNSSEAETSDEPVSEPDPPPDAVADGFDIEAARDATQQAIFETAFEVAGFYSRYEESDPEQTTQSRMKTARGNAADTARHINGYDEAFTLADHPSDADSFRDRYFANGEVVQRSVRDDDTDYDRDETVYDEFAGLVEYDLQSYYEAGTNFEFGEPEWDPDDGVYTVRGTEVADESEIDEDVEIRECVVKVNPDGVVVAIRAELSVDETVIKTAIDGTAEIDISISEPDWVAEADKMLPEWTYRTGERPMTSLVGDTVYVSSSDGVVALDRFDGTTDWRLQAEMGSRDTWTHAVTEDTVFVNSPDGLSAHSRDDGTELWTSPLKGLPNPISNIVLVSAQSNVYGVDADNGTEIWSLETDRSFAGRTVASNFLYISDIRGRVDAIDIETGERQWQFDAPTRNWLSPATVANGRLYAGSFEGSVYAIDAEDGTPDWTTPTADVVNSIALDSDAVYCGNRAGEVYALSRDSGESIWTYGTDDTARVHRHPDEDAVFVASHDGTLSRLSTTDGGEQWVFESDGWVESPTVADETVYVGSRDENIYALNATDGSVRWRRETNFFVRRAPIVTDELVYATDLGRGGGIVYAFHRDEA